MRYAFRTLVASPGFTITAVICLALGIGATSAMFSLVNAVLLRPLRYRDPDKLVRLYTEFPTFPNGGLRRFWTSAPEWDELSRRASIIFVSRCSGPASGGRNVSASPSKDPVRINATGVTGGMFETLGVSSMLGRTITKADDVKGALPVTVLSYSFFQSAFGGDMSVLNRVLKINGEDTNVIGVMPPGFNFPPGDLEPAEASVSSTAWPGRNEAQRRPLLAPRRQAETRSTARAGQIGDRRPCRCVACA